MNAQKKLSFEIAGVINGTNHSVCVHKQESQCPIMNSTTLVTTYLSFICVLGIASNVVLLYSDYKEWKRRKTPDKVLICNMTIINLAALLISLPFQVVEVWQKPVCGKGPRRGFKASTVQKYSLIICTIASTATLGVLGIDRLDALTKFPHQRMLTVTKAIIASVLVWLVSFLPLPFFLLKVSIMPLLLSIWTSISCIAIVTSLLLATRRIRKHRQEIIQMFGARQARAEIKFTKTVVALCLCFVIFMSPHLLVSFRVILSHEDPLRCTMSLLMAMTYLSFALLPIVYFAMDRKMLSWVLRKPIVPSTSADSKTKTKDEKMQDMPRQPVNPAQTTSAKSDTEQQRVPASGGQKDATERCSRNCKDTYS